MTFSFDYGGLSHVKYLAEVLLRSGARSGVRCSSHRTRYRPVTTHQSGKNAQTHEEESFPRIRIVSVENHTMRHHHRLIQKCLVTLRLCHAFIIRICAKTINRVWKELFTYSVYLNCMKYLRFIEFDPSLGVGIKKRPGTPFLRSL